MNKHERFQRRLQPRRQGDSARTPSGGGARPRRKQVEVAYDRLVPSPVFVLSTERSGSTLLRAVLNAHSQIHAPHELHLRQLKVELPELARMGMADLGFTARELENLLWDRMLHVRLVASGKAIVVDKTPHNLRGWRRIHRYWPGAKYIFLYRHPQRIFESMVKAWPQLDRAQIESRLVDKLTELEEASKTLPGLAIRYERLTTDPTAVTREVCTHLGVAWEPSMVRYDPTNGGVAWEKFLGDWGQNIKSGEIRADKPPPMPEEINPGLIKVTKSIGYPV